jgi:hypothetical protein
MDMAKEQQLGLWSSLKGQDGAAFVGHDRRLRRPRPAAVPVRLVVATGGGAAAVVQPFCKVPPLVPAGAATGAGAGAAEGAMAAPLTLGALLRDQLQGLRSPGPPRGDGDNGDNGDNGGNDGDLGVEAVCHGVALPLATPLAEAWAALAHPDHFLYVAVVPRRLREQQEHRPVR